MNHSKEAQEYWDTEGIRYLAEGNQVPSVEDRVKAAFDAGVNSLPKIWNQRHYHKCIINFPQTEL